MSKKERPRSSFLKKYHGGPGPLIRDLQTKSEKEWIKGGEKEALGLFRAMSSRVPAYRSFLKKNKRKAVSSFTEWKKLPITNKDNYLRAYTTKELCWDGMFAGGSWVVASTSGSTGIPYYFPRTDIEDKQFGLTADLLFRDVFETDKHSTLFVNCFALGIWIGGMFMYQASKYLAASGAHKIAVTTPGADHLEALKTIRSLAKDFDQVVIGGYAPLVKDLIDRGKAEGIHWNTMHVRYFFAAEGFTEGFRDYLVRHGGARDIYRDAINHYGTADMGTMAHETPQSIFIRRYAGAHPELNHALFGKGKRQPTLAQYVPGLFYFEEEEGRLLCSGYSGLPLVRYDLKDVGGVLSWDRVSELFLEHTGEKLETLLKREGLWKKKWNLPFVYLHERNDFTVSIYSVNIYPETVRRALEMHEFEQELTGKFTMQVDYDLEQNQYWEVVAELRDGMESSEALVGRIRAALITMLAEENSEWKDFYDRADIREKIVPHVTIRPHRDPEYFSGKGKQRWVKKK